MQTFVFVLQALCTRAKLNVSAPTDMIRQLYADILELCLGVQQKQCSQAGLCADCEKVQKRLRHKHQTDMLQCLHAHKW